MACCVLISLYIKEELSFDEFHENADRIVAVGVESKFFGQRLTTPYPLADVMTKEIPGVEKAIRYSGGGTMLVSTDGKDPLDINEPNLSRYTEPGFFEIFSFDMIYGNPKEALSSPNSIVLTERARQKLFTADVNPVGKILHWHKDDSVKTLTVTGVIEDPPTNSTLQYGSLISYNTTEKGRRSPDSWGRFGPQTYALLKSSHVKQTLPEQLKKLAQDKYGAEETATTFFGVSLPALHLSELSTDEGFTGNRAYLYLFGSVAIFILIIACVNYVNLATARTTQRLQEVGVRKTLGAARGQVAGQFLGEAVLLSVSSFVIGLAIAQLALPYFNQLFGIEILWQANLVFLLWLLLAAIMVGLIAGIYPAVYLSGFAPAKILHSKLQDSPSGSWLRKSLVVMQFALAIILIVSVLVVQKQLRYTQDKDLGFNGEQVVALSINDKQRWENREAIADKLRNQSGIRDASIATSVPGEFNIRLGNTPDKISAENNTPSEDPIAFMPSVVDYRFLEMMNIDLLAGRTFSKERSTDIDAVILNKKAAAVLGWAPEEAIGKPVSLGRDGTVIGVVENFHISSLHEEVQPVLLRTSEPDAWGLRGFILAKLDPVQIATTMEVIKTEFEKYGERAFEYEFLDEKFNAMYRTELRLGRVISFFAVIAIFIACLGLYGLSTFSVDRRIKEIGIRKVLGATVTNIVGLLSIDFLKLVVVGFVIAIPIAWYAMGRWLQDFAYKVDIGIAVFALAGLCATLIAIITVSWQSIKAAVANPVESLRSE